MANQVFNISKGRDVEFFRNVNNNTPANSEIVIVLLQAAEVDDALNNYDDLASLIAAAGNTEATFSGYARKKLTDTDGITITVNDTANTVAIDIPDVIWTAAGSGGTNNSLVKLLVCYDADSTSGTDANIVPIYHYDFTATTNGENLEARPHSNGLSVQ